MYTTNPSATALSQGQSSGSIESHKKQIEDYLHESPSTQAELNEVFKKKGFSISSTQSRVGDLTAAWVAVAVDQRKSEVTEDTRKKPTPVWVYGLRRDVEENPNSFPNWKEHEYNRLTNSRNKDLTNQQEIVNRIKETEKRMKMINNAAPVNVIIIGSHVIHKQNGNKYTITHDRRPDGTLVGKSDNYGTYFPLNENEIELIN